MPERKRLLIVFHSRSGATESLCDAIVAAAADAGGPAVELAVLRAFDATAEDVMKADGLILGTPANFGYMSGALKDFFERIYHLCLEKTAGLAYTMFVKGDTDADGAVSSVERIVAGMKWRQVLPPVVVVGPVLEAHLDQVRELGATMAAGMEAGIF